MKLNSLRLPAAASLVAALALSSTAHGTAWITTTGSWGNPANWDAGVPGTGINAQINNGGTATITTGDIFTTNDLIPGENAGNSGTITQDGGSLASSGWIVIAKNNGGVGTYNLSGGDLSQTGGNTIIGENGGANGTFNISNTGAFTISSEFWVGQAGGTGVVNMTGGSITSTNWAAIGRAGGNGTINQSGGTITKTGNPWIIGDNSTGAMTVSSAAAFNSTSQVWVGQSAASNGTLTMSGGTFSVSGNNFAVGRNGGLGVFNLSGGTVTRNTNGGDFIIGMRDGSDNSRGTVNQTGGTLTANNWTQVGKGAGAIGNYNLSGGTVTQEGGRFMVGFETGNGTLTVSDTGLLNVNGDFWMGQDTGSVGVLNQTGGTINVNNWTTAGRNGSTGTINVSGGVFNKTGAGNISIASGGGAVGTGTFSISGTGTVNSTTTVIISETGGTATFTMSGSGVANFPALEIGAAGTTHLNGGTLAVTQTTGAGTLNFNGGTLKANTGATATLLDHTGAARVRNGGAIIDTNGQNIGLTKALTHSDIGGDNATDGGLSKIGLGTLTLSGSNTYTGTTGIAVGTLALGASNILADASSVTVTGGTFDLGANTDTVSSLSVSSGSVTGTGTLNVATVNLTNTAGTVTVSAPLAGTTLLTKTGAGTAILSGANAYAGTTRVSAGTLGLGSTGSLNPVSILEVQSGATLDLRNGAGSRNLTVDNLTLSGGTLHIGLGGTTTDKLTVGDVTTISGSNTIKLVGSVNAGTYTLLATSGSLAGKTFVLDTSALVTGFTTYGGSINGNNYQISVGGTPAPATAYWLGGVSGTWSDASSAPTSNWASDATGTTNAGQIPGAASDIVFSAAGAANTATTLGADFSVKSITFATGSASVGGANALTIVGANTNGHALEVASGATGTLNAAATFAGTTNVQSGGTLNAGTGALGDATGTVSVAGTLNVNGANTKAVLSGTGTVAGSSVLTLDFASNSTFDGSFTGAVGLTKAGAGTLTLTGASSHSGVTTVSAGTLAIGNGGTTGSLGTSAVSLAGGTTLSLNRSDTYSWSAPLSGGGALNKVGTGTSTYTGTDTRTGATTVSAGTLVNAGSFSGGSLNVTGGTFQNTTGSFSTAVDANVGNTGTTGTLLVDGGTFNQTAGIIYIGRNGGSGTYTQTGGTVTAPGGYRLGTGTGGSTATATLTAGDLSTTGEFWISDSAGNSASMTMSGGNLTTGNWFVIGRNPGATGSMTLSGGTVSKGGGGNSILGSLGGTGTLTQTGGAFNTTTGAVLLGESGNGTPALNTLWNMSGGTSSVAADINVSWRSSEATWNVSGSSVVTSAGRLAVACENTDGGANGTGLNGSVVNGAPVGTVNISGGSVSFTNAAGESRIGGDVANAAGAIGSVTVSGGSLSMAGNVHVGGYGTGTLNVSNSGSVTSPGWFSVGRFAGSNGTINVSGGTLTQSDPAKLLMIAEDGTGTLNLSGTGVVDCSELRVGHNPTGNGTFNLNGGTLFTKVIQKTAPASTAAIRLNGGTIRSKADAASLFLDVPAASLSVDQGGAKFDTNGFAVTVTQPLTKVAATTGGITKSGAGTLTLAGTSDMTGPVAINGGTLVPGTDSSIGSGAVSVASSGTLNVNGILLTNNVTVAVGGTLAGAGEVNDANVSGNLQPGGANTIGDLTVSGAFTLAQGSTATFELGGASAALADGVVANDGVNLDGQIAVTLVNGYVPAAGHSFTLIDNQFGSGMTFSGFDVNTDLTLPALGSGLAWQRSLTSSALTITVVSSDPAVSYAVTFGLSGNNALPGADPDGDGISNALEYAFGISPIANNGPEYRGVASTTSGALTLAYRRPLNGVSGVTYGVEFKTADLVVGNTGWSTGVLNTDYTQSVTPNGDGTTETVTINLIGAVSGKKFARVSVTY